MEVPRYGFRLIGLVATAPLLPLLLSTGLLLDRSVTGLVFAFVGLVLAPAVALWVARRRSLTCWRGGLLVQLDEYRLSVSWEDLVRVQCVRHRGVLRVEELVFRQARADPVTSRGRKGRLPPGLDEHPAETRVMVSLFDRDWRRGPIGSYARAAGLDV